MTRTERRRAEHLARKAAYKAGKQNPSAPAIPSVAAVEPPPLPQTIEDHIATVLTAKPEISAARLAANRANAELSTGPKTETGKAICSHNAVKTALTGRTVILPTDDISAYQNLGSQLIEQHQPATPEEERLVQRLIDSEWRLMRIPTLESGIHAIGRRELAGAVPTETLETEIYLKYERTLKNLYLQETRIRRHREKDLQALGELQAARREAEGVARKIAQIKAELRRQPQPPQEQTQTAPSQPDGSEFATPEIGRETALGQTA